MMRFVIILTASCAVGVIASDKIIDLAPNTVSTESGGEVLATFSDDLPPDGDVTCEVCLAWDGWAIDDPVIRAGVRVGANQVKCVAQPLAAEGPYMLDIKVNGTRVDKAALWYATPLAVSFSEQPYFAVDSGELLVRTNVSVDHNGGLPPLRVIATDADGTVLLNQNVGLCEKKSLTVHFHGLNTTLDAWISVQLQQQEGADDFATLATRSVRLMRAPEMKRGRSAVDFKRRSLLVDGRPFLGIGWFSTYLSFGIEQTIDSMRDMARRGTNQVMVYNLVPKDATFQDRALPLPDAVMDAAATLGMKVHLYLLDVAAPLAKNQSSDWAALRNIVATYRDHPALLSWYVADDFSGPLLPQVYKEIKALDPYHIVSVAIAGAGDARDTIYRTGADLTMIEDYPATASGAHATMNVITRHPTEFMPAMVCGRGWATATPAGGGNAITSPAMFRAQHYNALVAGATGQLWFANRNQDGWNEPGIPLLEASGPLSREMLDLVPSLITAGDYDAATTIPQPTIVGRNQDGIVELRQDALRTRAYREESGCVTVIVVNSLAEPMQAVVDFARGTAGIFDDVTTETEALVIFEKTGTHLRRVSVKDGQFAEWLPSYGTQAFQLNGTSSCAVPAGAPSQLPGQSPNLIENPSFENSLTYIAAPDQWDCMMAPQPKGLPYTSCFADSTVQKTGRHAGRFVSGANPFAFVAKPTYNVKTAGIYRGSVWAQSDAAMHLSVVIGDSDEAIAETSLTSDWQQLTFEVNLPVGARSLGFKTSHPGVFWLDDAELRLMPSSELSI